MQQNEQILSEPSESVQDAALPNSDAAGFIGTSDFLVLFSSYDKRIPCGVVRCSYFKGDFSFCGLDHMLLLIEDLMDFDRTICFPAHYPQACFKRRRLPLHPDYYEVDFENTNFERSSNRMWLDHAFTNHQPHVLISVYYRQAGTLQGCLCAAKERVDFRSGLELLRLIYQYLEMEAAQRSASRKRQRKKQHSDSEPEGAS